jgi:hypothetical protein
MNRVTLRAHLHPPRRRRLTALVTAGLWLLAPLPAALAQQPAAVTPLPAAVAPPAPAPSVDPELVQKLLKRVEDLEAQVKALQAERRQPRAPTPPPVLTGPELYGAMPEGGPGLQLRGFADIDFHTSDLKGSNSAFQLGQLDLFITSRLSDKASVLNENVVESDANGVYAFKIERLLFQYSANRFLNLAFGRFHSNVGFYNTEYHHGTWFQTATGRPFLYRGGILPIHNVGLSLTGAIPSGRMGMRYALDIGNGRSSRTTGAAEVTQNVVDENNHKALNVALIARPDQVPGLQLGISVYRDKYQKSGTPSIGETIKVAHVVYQTPIFEWLNEGVLIHHSQGKGYNTRGYYTQVSRLFGKFRPFFRYQYVNAPDDDPVLAGVGVRSGPSFGLRYDLDASTALKLQYDHTKRRGLSSFNELTLQSAFTF